MKSIVYAYDIGGNITSVSEYAYQTGSSVSGFATATKSYTYGDSNWKDKLTKYNGTTITYDAIGNPLSYYNGYTFTWTQGRKLSTASNGTNSISYAYNSDGIRIKKTVNGTVTNYTLDGTKVIQETTGSDTIRYYYDEGNAPVAFKLNGTLYAYTKNLQGDITGIVNTAGTKLVSYVYDAWGKVTATNAAGNSTGSTLIAKNPYLYRGYRYDSETGFYYLNSRYYDPGTGRFINADEFVSTGTSGLSCNMFAYCVNNPVNYMDADGTWPTWTSVFAAIAIVATVVAIAAVCVATGGAAVVVGSSAAAAAITAETVAVASDVALISFEVAICSSTVTAISVAAESVSYSKAKAQAKYVPDPYARPGQKKQGRENKNKNRKKPNYEPRNNRRDGKPARLKHHTPMKDHQKFEQ